MAGSIEKRERGGSKVAAGASEEPRQLRFRLKSARPAPPFDLPAAETLEQQASEKLREIGAIELAARVRVKWHLRLRTTAGLAYSSRALVLLNPRLAAFGTDEIRRTLLHELAHLLAFERAGRCRIAPHGAEWRTACRDLGLENESRTHTLALPRRSMARRHVYRCPACLKDIRRVRPFRIAVACLSCCRAHSRGRYDSRFRLVKLRPA